jgi:antitoxin component of MazEF toxin-antitoxin module
MDIHRARKEDDKMGYPTKIQLISRKKGQQWYVNFPNALAQAMNFEKGETVEWTVLSTTCLQMERKSRQQKGCRKNPKTAATL